MLFGPRIMEWYYALNDQRLGPVTVADFDKLVQAGTITPATFVWHEGMAAWLPHREVAAPSAIPMQLAAETERCAECGKVFPKADMLVFEKLHVCGACKPLFFQKMQEGVAVGGARVWRSGKFVVMGLTPELPARCVKCNADTGDSRLKRKLRWHPPLVYLALLANLIIYAIIASIVSKKLDVNVGICALHRSKRVRNIAIGWVLALAGIGAIPWGISAENGYLSVVGVVLFIVGLIWGVVGGRVVFAKKIDKDNAWMGGCGKDYLAALPEWPGKI